MADAFFPTSQHLASVKYKYGPFYFHEVLLFSMAFATIALADVIVSVGTLSKMG